MMGLTGAAGTCQPPLPGGPLLSLGGGPGGRGRCLARASSSKRARLGPFWKSPFWLSAILRRHRGDRIPHGERVCGNFDMADF